MNLKRNGLYSFLVIQYIKPSPVEGGGKVLGTIVRFVVAALVLMLVSWLLPGIKVAGFTGA